MSEGGPNVGGLGGTAVERRRNLEAIAFLALLLSFGTVSLFNLVTRPIVCFPGDIGLIKCPLSPGTHDVTPLGTWVNMPSAATELFGNTTYRGFVLTGGAVYGIQVASTVVCVSPSNTAGAKLQLQYANYTTTSHTNTTNFINVSGSILIDNSNNWPCPGVLTGSIQSISRSGINSGWIFRVIGSGGGGIGDNPRFSFAGAALKVNLQDVPFDLLPTSVSATGFTPQARSPVLKTDVTTTVNFNWIAQNSTIVSSPLAEDGSGSCSIPAGASAANCAAITFSIAFAAAPIVILQSTSQGPTVQLPIGSLNLLVAETVTV